MSGMLPRTLPTIPEEQMKWRARAYLTVGGTRHVGMATLALLLNHWDLDAEDLVVVGIVPLPVWAVIFGFGALHMLGAALFGSGDHARTSLVISAGMTTAWAVGAAFSALLATSQSWTAALWTGAILLAALALKDLIQCADPLRSPFDPVVRRLTPRRER